MKKFLKLKVLPYFVYLLVRIVLLTNKKNFHHPKLKDDEAFIFVSWHGDLITQPYNYNNCRKTKKLRAMISQSKDGEIISKIFAYFNVDAIRGSSSKGAAKALISTIKEIKSGNDIAITPDGPRGPRFSVAKGVYAIASKSEARVIAMGSIPSSYWQFDSWDKFVLPKPFGVIDFYLSEPFDISKLDEESANKLLKEKIMHRAMP
jgi:lysophospholipid acyltransferase (LPLAT)-like uncharacterized protein